MKRKVVVAALFVALAATFYACVDEGPGSDFDGDGIADEIEDANDNFVYDAGESDYIRVDTDIDSLCDGLPSQPLAACTGCEDCNRNGFWEPCLTETDPLNDDTDNDAIRDDQDPAPVGNFDCSGGTNPRLAYGGSLPPGKPFPSAPTPTVSPAPFPTSTPAPVPTPTP